MKQALASRLLFRSGLGQLLAGAMPWSGVLVLNYHRIGDGSRSQFDRGLWSATAEAFAEQIRLFKSHLDLISLDDLPDALARRRGRYGLITFDDGYRDNYEVAFPILKAEGARAAFFIATGFIDNPRLPWWDEIAWMTRTSRRQGIELSEWLASPLSFDEPDRERAVRTLLRVYKSMPADSTEKYLDAIAQATGSGRCSIELSKDLWMTWDMIREMHAAGMTIGGHTVNHPLLTRVSPQRQREEIQGCVARLTEIIGQPPRYFSYPVGGKDAFDNVTRDCLKEAGIRCAFSYYGGFRSFVDWDDYDVRRVPVESYLSNDWFQAIVSLPRFFA